MCAGARASHNSDTVAGIYLHIPFCKSRCTYCDFYSTTALAQRDRYVAALCRELTQRAATATPVNTIYIGGGTPSQLAVRQIAHLLRTIHDHYRVAADAEITMELNPDDVSADYAHALSATPVNRVSLGIQTFCDDRLRLLRRRHTAADAVQAVRTLQSAGFANISIDLMFGFPDETETQWHDDVEQALLLRVPHISAYSLMYEEGTRLTRMLRQGQIRETDDETVLRMYRLLTTRLREAGYEHYEISNYCLPGSHSRHNSSYWDGTPYAGFGCAAHSFDGTTRSWNPAHLHTYIISMEQQGHISRESETLTTAQRYNERIMTRLRTARGADLDRLRRDFGQHLYDYCLRMAQPHLRDGRLRITDDRRLCLTDEGIFVSDSVMSDLMSV